MATNTTTKTRLTPVQRTAMTEAAGNWRGVIPNGLHIRTLSVMHERGWVYEGDYRRGRRIAVARAAGFTGFPSFYLTRAGYTALGMNPWLVCTQCGTGNYEPARGGRFGYQCTAGCGHEITRAELQLQPGESVDLRDGILAVLWCEPETGKPRTDAGDCGQCDKVLVWDGTGARVHDVHGEYLCSTGRDSQATSAVHVRRSTPVATVAPRIVPEPEVEVEPETLFAIEPAPAQDAPAEHPDEQLQQLTESTHAAGGTYHANGTTVVRLYPAEGGPVGEPYQDRCPCCDEQFTGVTAGMITPPDEMQPLQRVRWSDGGTSDWPPHLLQQLA